MVRIPDEFLRVLNQFGDRRFLAVRVNSKEATDPGWQNTLMTQEEIQPWLNRGGNYGVCAEKPLIIFDCDKTQYLDSFPKTLTVRTASGNFHLYLESDAFKNGIMDGCHIQVWHKYVVGPGSLIDGKAYEMVNDGSIATFNIADFDRVFGDKVKWTQHAKTGELIGVPEGGGLLQGRDNSLFVLACRFRREGYSQEEVVDQCWAINRTYDPPLSLDKVKEKVESAFKYKIDALQFYGQTETGRIGFLHVKFAKFLLNKYRFKTMRDDKTIYVYNPAKGIYEPKGEAVIHQELAEILDECTHKQYYGEVEFYLQGVTYIDRPGLNMQIACLNGLLDVKERVLSPFNPDGFILNQIPVKYDPKAECPNIDKAVIQILGDTQKCTFCEGVGYSLYKATPIHKAQLLVGSGANGKSTLLEVIKAFLGEENVSNVPLQAICGDRFASAELYGKLANICADLPDRRLVQTGTFKMATGGDTLRGEKKFHDGFSYKNHAKMWFSCNKVPETYDDTEAFFRRWNIINCPNKFEGANCDKNILTKLTTPEELSGLLNQSLNALKDLLDHGDFCQNETTSQIRTNYMRGSNSCRAFIEEALQPADQVKDQMTNETLYEYYQTFCRNNKLEPKTKRQLTINMQQYMPTARPISLQITVGDKKATVRGWRYLTVKLDALDGSISKTNVDFPKISGKKEEREVSNASKPDGQTHLPSHLASKRFPRCPVCRRKLMRRKAGYVCKNWKCQNYWKMGKGPVYPFSYQGR
jgi:P4 family phage/plasmid primase-like protien